MRLISQRKEINCFEGMGLKGLCFNEDLLFLSVENRALEGERRITYVHACRSLVSILPTFFFLSLLFLFFLSFYLFLAILS